MKRHGAERRKLDEISPQPLSGNAAFCSAGFDCIRIFKPAASLRSLELYHLVIVAVSVIWNWNRLGDVSGFALGTAFFRVERFFLCANGVSRIAETAQRVKLTAIFRGW
jgi:hypothetical protein